MARQHADMHLVRLLGQLQLACQDVCWTCWLVSPNSGLFGRHLVTLPLSRKNAMIA
jgi:hypothetical protein